MIWNWWQAAAFYDRVDRLGLHGLHFQHVALCDRRAWLFLHNVNFAQWYGRVQIGTARHSTSYARDRSTDGLFGLSPDRIDWENFVIYENKGTSGAKVASDNQTAFYAVMLSIATGCDWKAVTHVLSSRRRREVLINEKRLESLWKASERLESLSERDAIPNSPRIPLCAKCSAASFCGND